MKILVINCGSSSAKYQLIDMQDESVIAKGYYERIGQKEAYLTHKAKGQEIVITEFVKNHTEAINIILKQLLHKDYGVINDLSEIAGVGHRIVHGGEYFTESVIVTDDVKNKINECAKLAPLHNPAHLMGIEACQELMPNTKMVVVFDTAFHQTIPAKAHMYAIPHEYYEKYKIRKYGFHGTSHRYVANRVAELENKDVKDLKIVTCHLGQGASLCAVKGGKSVDTTMGLTPLGGIVMCSRSGDLDPSIVTYIMEKEKISPEEMNSILNKKSGIYGLTKISPDFRDIEFAAEKGEEMALLGLDMHAYVVAQYIAKFAVSLGGIDVIAFAGGVGERGIEVRRDICKYLEFMGLKLDMELNNAKAVERKISTNDSKINVYIVPTNEELMIARETMQKI